MCLSFISHFVVLGNETQGSGKLSTTELHPDSTVRTCSLGVLLVHTHHHFFLLVFFLEFYVHGFPNPAPSLAPSHPNLTSPSLMAWLLHCPAHVRLPSQQLGWQPQDSTPRVPHRLLTYYFCDLRAPVVGRLAPELGGKPWQLPTQRSGPSRSCPLVPQGGHQPSPPTGN